MLIPNPALTIEITDGDLPVRVLGYRGSQAGVRFATEEMGNAFRNLDPAIAEAALATPPAFLWGQAYDSEVDLSVSTSWDGGFDFAVGTAPNAVVARGGTRFADDAIRLAVVTAAALYPDSVLTKGLAALDLDGLLADHTDHLALFPDFAVEAHPGTGEYSSIGWTVTVAYDSYGGDGTNGMAEAVQFAYQSLVKGLPWTAVEPTEGAPTPFWSIEAIGPHGSLPVRTWVRHEDATQIVAKHNT